MFQDNAWFIAIALRISPVPLGLQNGILAVTVSLQVYFGSLLFALPEQVLFVYFGKEASQLMDLLSGKVSPHSGQIYLMIFDVVVGMLLFGAVIYFGKKVWNRALVKSLLYFLFILL